MFGSLRTVNVWPAEIAPSGASTVTPENDTEMAPPSLTTVRSLPCWVGDSEGVGEGTDVGEGVGPGAGDFFKNLMRTIVFLPLRTRTFFFGFTVAPAALTVYSPCRSRYVFVEVPILRKPLDRTV